MVNEYRFFYTLTDKKPKYINSKIFIQVKMIILLAFSILGLMLYFNKLCNYITFVLFEISVVYYSFVSENKKFSTIFLFAMSVLWFFECVIFSIFANAFVYLSVLIFLNLISISKGGDLYIQFSKKVTYCNKHLFLIFEVILFLIIYYFDYCWGAKFIVFDVLTSCYLVGFWILKNERYFMSCHFGVFTMLSEIWLWLKIYYEFNNFNAVLLCLIYLYNLILIVVDMLFLLRDNENYKNLFLYKIIKNDKNRLKTNKIN